MSGLAGLLVARLYRQSRPSTGAFTVAAMFSNNGPTLGGFLCLLYLGSEALVISQVFALFCIPYYFTVVLLTARIFSPGRKTSLWHAVKMNFSDPISILPISATVIGLVLGFTGTKFPPLLDLPMRILVFAAVILYSISFGLGMQIRMMAKRFTIYLGSEYEREMLKKAAQAVYQAHQHGLLTVLWIYPRGKAVADEKDPHLIAGATGAAVCLGSDFVKVNYPKQAGMESKEIFKEAVAAAGRTGVVCAGGSSTDAEAFLQRLHDQIVSGACGNATGRNIHQKGLKEAISMCNAIYAVTVEGKTVAQAIQIYKK